jgi:hypothetical protein
VALDVSDPQLIRSGYGEGTFDKVRAGVRAGTGHCGARPLGPAQATQPGRAHQPLHGAPSHRMRLTAQLGVDASGAVAPEILAVQPDQRGGGRVSDRRTEGVRARCA